MVRIIGVRFRTAGKVYFFDPLQFEIKRGDHVIVETARGIEFGTVVSDIREVGEDRVVQPLKPVIRIANERDMEQEKANRVREKEAFKICLEKIHKHGLEMKLIDAEYTFDNNKVLFYFTADGRIDFRELVKDLAGVFKTRIELRQIGVRDETKIIGGIGICGRPLCCHSYLSDFIPVSIKMAKEQNLSLNPTKISGVCGRLMCCLKNEEETYEELNRRLPNIGDLVTAEDGSKGEVQSVNVLRQLVKVVVEEGDSKEIREYEVGKLHFKRKHTKKERMELSPEELSELERLEEVELEDIQNEEKEKEAETAERRGGNGRDRERRGEGGGSRRSGGRENRGEHRQNFRGERGDNRNGERGDNRSSERSDNRHDNRSDNRSGERSDNRSDKRGDSRRDNRGDNRSSERSDNRNGERSDNRSDKRGDSRYDNRSDIRNGERGDNRNGERGDNRNGERGDSRYDNRGDNRGERRNDDHPGERRFKRDRRNRQGGKSEQNGNAGNSSEAQ